MVTIGISLFPEKNSGIEIGAIDSPDGGMKTWIDSIRPYGYRMSGFNYDGYSGYIDYGQRVVMPYDPSHPDVAKDITGTIKQIVEVLRVGDDGAIHGGSIDLVYLLPNGREATLPLIGFSNNKTGPNKAYYSIHNIDESDQRGTANINVELNFFQFMSQNLPSETQFNFYTSEFPGSWVGEYVGNINNWLVINQNFPQASGEEVTHDVVVSCYVEYGGSYVTSRDHSVTLKDVEELIRIDRLGIATGGSQIYVRY